jgi:hypothetical protein
MIADAAGQRGEPVVPVAGEFSWRPRVTLAGGRALRQLPPQLAVTWLAPTGSATPFIWTISQLTGRLSLKPGTDAAERISTPATRYSTPTGRRAR